MCKSFAYKLFVLPNMVLGKTEYSNAVNAHYTFQLFMSFWPNPICADVVHSLILMSSSSSGSTMLVSLASSMDEAILAVHGGSSIRHGVFLRGGRLIQTLCLKGSIYHTREACI